MMSDPRKLNYDANSFEHDSPRIFADFQRIRVNSERKSLPEQYQDLPRTRQQELVEKLIDRVRDI